jgi:hypothetical protein
MPVRVRRRHLLVFVGRRDPADELTPRRLARHDRELPGLGGGEGTLLVV